MLFITPALPLFGAGNLPMPEIACTSVCPCGWGTAHRHAPEKGLLVHVPRCPTYEITECEWARLGTPTPSHNDCVQFRLVRAATI
ncbi:hypothetical protein CGMCC3_g7129 [Colletotrichum fructicola]|nr:uncharacterized protein CGMCC3_g7129 [Colletotrichum fructicola]KAE9576678.1 hypothetical protein CGMCC3_g7129 [Colletotrichum fructicola]